MKARSPKVSVIMCTYNRKVFLERSIGSILSQTFDDLEFILVNNGSTDGSDGVCAKYAEKDDRIKLINIMNNQGASNGRNRGLDEASGTFITIVDDDDYCEPQMIEFLWDLANRHDADISICGSWYEVNGVRKEKFISDETLVLDKVRGLDELLKRKKYNVSPPTKLFRNYLFKDIRFKDNVIIDDIHIIYKIFAKAATVAFQGSPLYTFVRHGENMTSYNQTNNLTPDLLDEYLTMYSERTRYLAEKVPAVLSRARYSEWSYMISMCDKIKRYNCSDCTKVYGFMVESLKNNYTEFINSPFITERERQLLQLHVPGGELPNYHNPFERI